MSLSQLKQIPLSISAILQSLRLYPPRHPQVSKQLQSSVATLQKLLSGQEKLSIALIDDTLLLNEIPCLDKLPALQELKRLFERQQLHIVEILPEIDQRQLLIFCVELPQLLGGNFADRLKKAGVTAIRANLIEEEIEGAQAVYRNALRVIEDVCNDVRMGHIPSSRKVVSSVKGMVKSILAEPYALLAMSSLKDYDNYTFSHSVNVAVIAISVGKACGLREPQLHALGLGGLLHDLGKMTIDHDILAKPGKLSREELEIMQLHPGNGAKLVADMEQISQEVIDIVNHHHLRYDRTGYPANERGSLVTPLADMVGIADAYDAMTTTRCYQRPFSPRQAIDRMRTMSGNHLHPEYLERFLEYLGPYPVGSLVRLRDGRIGLVSDQDRQQSGSLTLKIIFDGNGRKLAEPPLVNLANSGNIVAEINPTLKGITLDEYLP